MKHLDDRSGSRHLLLCILAGLLPLLLAANHATLGPTRIVFLHHSCGHNLIEQGGVREGLTDLGYEFYDHGYNEEGLRLADGSYAGTDFDVPGDNTDPDGMAAIFAQPLHDPPDNTFSHLMQYDVIAFKSCFPTSNIGSDDQLDEYKSYYLSIRDRMDQYPDKIFVVVTQPPQVPGASDPGEARRARALAEWLSSDEYLSGHPNVFTFDFFGHLSGDDNFLRPEYRVDDYDGHPNERANGEIGPRFVAFLDEAIRSYAAGEPRPAPPEGDATAPPPTPTPPPESEGTEIASPPPPASPAPGGPPMIDDFESTTAHWDSSTDAQGSTVECGPDTGGAYEGAGSLRIAYRVAPHGWVDCGRSFASPQDWSAGQGISMWLYADGTADWVTLMVFSGDPEAPTPFEVALAPSSESVGGWSQIGFSWTSFERAPWADEGGLAEVDPTRIVGYGFSLGADEDGGQGVLRVDAVHVSSGAAPPLVIPSATPTTGPAAPTEAPTEEPTSGPVETAPRRRGVCPGAAALPSLGLLGALILRRQRSADTTKSADPNNAT